MEESHTIAQSRLRPRITASHIKWAVVLLAALALRLLLVWLLKWNNPDGDEAVAGLMAKHIAEGRDFPLFYYGQSYFGTLESYLNAILFLVFGFIPNLIYVLPVIFCIGLIGAEYLFARALVDEATAQRSALVMAIAPVQLLIGNLGAGGGFALGLLLEILALWLFTLIYFHPKKDARAFFWFCLVSGATCWVWQIYIPILVVLVVLLALRPLALSWRELLLGVGLFFIASSPLWIYNWQNGGATFLQGVDKVTAAGDQADLRSTLAATLENRLENWNTYLRLWIRAPGVSNPALGLIVVVGIVANWRQFKILVRRRSVQLSPLAFGLVMAGAFFVVGNRYVHYLFILLPLLLPLALQGWQTWKRVPQAILIAVILVTNLYTVWSVTRTPAPHPDWDAVIQQLEAHQVVYGYSDYWSAYPITFLTNEKIIISPRLLTFSGWRTDRYPAYTMQVMRAERVFVLASPSSPDSPMAVEIANASVHTPPLEQVTLPEGVLYFPLGRDDALRQWVEGLKPD